MLSEKVLFALNTVNDAYLEETRELLDRSAVSQKPAKSRIVRTILIAAVLAALMAATAYAIVSIHQKRQQPQLMPLYRSIRSGSRSSGRA